MYKNDDSDVEINFIYEIIISNVQEGNSFRVKKLNDIVKSSVKCSDG